MLAALLPAALCLASPEAKQDTRWLLTGVIRTHPQGGLLGAEAIFPIPDIDLDLAYGAFGAYAYYWAELGAKAELRYLDGFLIGGLWLGLEPGDFIPAEGNREDRQGGLRGLLRARLELNLRYEYVWLYSRSTAEGRLRSFAEYDPYRDAVLDEELSFEQALSPLFAVFRWGDRSALSASTRGQTVWLYAELTVSAEPSVGLLDLRPSAGLIAEEVLPGLTLDLDVYRSFRSGPLEGFGVLLFVWWRP